METSNRYNRQMILPEIGEGGQDKLAKAKVLVIGAGGLGAAILPYLAAAGVGEIGIVDDDVIEISNLHRQVIYKSSAVGKSKAKEAKQMISELNPLVKVKAISEKLSGKNVLSLFEKYDIVVDATDSISIKYLINDACLVTNKPMVYGSIFRFQGQVSVFNYENGPTYRCLYPDENSNALNCEDAGVIGVSVGIIGMFQANEVLKMILGIGEVLSGKILVYNVLNNEQQKYDFDKSDFQPISRETFEEKYNKWEVEEVRFESVLDEINQDEVLFLDVRNIDESPKITLQNQFQIPLMHLEKEIEKLNKNQTIYIFCQSGIRSKIAVELLQKHQFKNVKSIAGGALAMKQLLQEIKI
ncbi:HesA/MoeB/ThiF family protein [Flavobacterium johnsoniae]|uniref:Molybdopterin-synthase adenylyltransferase n=1 Tax=Flavobacterium johnsoniae (strain ATCC 17061 / DSM 2064 / JCM 8514 / BCRC 14874 / CCUG 350202 / NBRC 14942 / NCIMB 11054 / UW101) TaxID=376686 RepID=A5FAY8_FLAJ1|nr:HesA/MoeB/ThiF family protein [Flavobacterium johnsoniae]ABQ07638.1 UBA/THIF-type NAD/FAD binding protein [Flavobacterium johnsoniae UW101]OXG01724.1 thiamine biosynthesis protein ThiF [Flavobacterium johnsoniae UW101]WQG80523.1 HesA/MoeB/ThiF family protein [Flavobacterium johnsoniae UW101]